MNLTKDPILLALRAERRHRKLSQQDLSDLLGRPNYVAVSKWERGIQSPRLANLRAWAAVLGFDLVIRRRPAAK